jgi:inner membrane protein
MASLGHIAVGLAAARVHRSGARPRWPAMAWWSALSMLPDADVIGFSIGVLYGDPWGHRGATHSLLFACAVGAALGIAARPIKLPPFRTWAIATVVLISHGLLDTLTTGGLGCALFWPFDLTRYFAPWRPIPVAPIGWDFLSPSGVFVATMEVVLFAPVFVYGLRRKPVHLALVPVWIAAAWLIASRDPVRESLLGFLLREDAEYGSGFSEAAFRAIKPGQLEADVRQRLGQPLGELWGYISSAEPPSAYPDFGCPFVYFESDIVTVPARDSGPATRLCAQRGITAGTSRAEVQRTLGSPRDVCLRYTRGASLRFHRGRTVCLTHGRVAALTTDWEPC